MKTRLSPKLALMVALASGPAILSGAYAGANTLTGLIPDLYAGMDVVSRELVGFIPSVYRDSSAERAAVGQNVDYHIAPANAASDISPAMTIPNPPDQTIGLGQMQITKARAVAFGYIGEEQRGLNAGPGYLSVQADQFAQALRTLCNEVEVDVATEAYKNASRAYGTAGTTPFATDLSATAQVRKILDDNGAPLSDRSLVIDTAAGAKLRTQTQLTRANEAGSLMTLRQGELLDIHGFSLKESAAVPTPAIGTGALATTDAAGYAVGSTTFTLASAGTGTLLAGDVITFAGDTNQYIITSGDADTSNGGTITIAQPGIRVAMSAATKAITVVAKSTRSIALVRSALHLVTRAPQRPKEGDQAADVMMITDPRSGLTFEVSIYLGYRKVRYEVALAWGQKAVKQAHIAALLG